MPKNRKPSQPGEILLHDFLEPMGKTQKDLSVHLGWTYAKINEIVNGKRGITERTALSFADTFKTTPQFWLNLQTNHDLWEAKQEHKKVKALAS